MARLVNVGYWKAQRQARGETERRTRQVSNHEQFSGPETMNGCEILARKERVTLHLSVDCDICD